MSDRWNIFKDGKPLGPFSAAEIREQLRSGDLDPFDLVAKEGSPVRRELVEVDELFSTPASPGVFEDSAKTETLGKSGQDRGLIDRLVASEGQLPGGFVPPSDAVQKGNLHLASAEAVNATQVSGGGFRGGGTGSGARKRKKDPKHYHLKDAKGRVLGPLSATDVQALFYKGVIDKSVMVSKQGSSAKVPVDKFVQVLSRSKGGSTRPRQQAAHPMMATGRQRPSKVQQLALMQKLRMDKVRGQRLLTMGLMAVAVAMLSLAAWLAYKKGAGSWISSRFAALTADEAPKPVKRPKLVAKPAPVEGSGKLPRPAAPPTPGAPTAPKPRIEVEELKRPSGRGRVPDTLEYTREQKRKKAAAAQQAKRKTEPKKAAKPKKGYREAAVTLDKLNIGIPPKPPKAAAATSKVAVAPAAPKPAPPPAPAPAAKQAPAPKPAAPPKPAGPSVAALADGQQISHFGPMRYDPGAVAKCTGACVVTFSGGGGSLTGRFFKDGFGEALAAHKGSAYISGIVRKSGGGTMVLIQDVQ